MNVQMNSLHLFNNFIFKSSIPIPYEIYSTQKLVEWTYIIKSPSISPIAGSNELYDIRSFTIFPSIYHSLKIREYFTESHGETRLVCENLIDIYISNRPQKNSKTAHRELRHSIPSHIYNLLLFSCKQLLAIVLDL